MSIKVEEGESPVSSVWGTGISMQDVRGIYPHVEALSRPNQMLDGVWGMPLMDSESTAGAQYHWYSNRTVAPSVMDDARNVTIPAPNPWVTLSVPESANTPEVREWLGEVNDRMANTLMHGQTVEYAAGINDDPILQYLIDRTTLMP